MELWLDTKTPAVYDTVPLGGVKRVLSINVKAFNPKTPGSIIMNVGETKPIDMSLDPDTACYEVIPLTPQTITGGAGLTLTPSPSTLLDITASKAGIYTVSLKV